MIKPEGSGLYAQDSTGKVALIGVSVEGTGADGGSVSKIKLTGDEIILEGSVTANGYFKILKDGSIETRNAKVYGTIYADDGKIGGFTLDDGRLYWKAGDYFGNDSRQPETRRVAVRYGRHRGCGFQRGHPGAVRSEGRRFQYGGAAIYASSKSDGLTYPISANTYAGYFDGGVHVNGAMYSNDMLSNNYGTGWTLGSDGTYTYRKGVSGNFRMDYKR